MSGNSAARVLAMARSRAAAILATAVIWAAVVVAVLLGLRIALALLDANPQNAIVSFVRHVADRLEGPFTLLFTPKDPKTQIAVNDGLAAVVYLIAGGLVSRGLRLLGGGGIR
jgi:hypothetical protein